MKTLKFLRSVAVDSIHREQGSVHDIDDKDARIVIADGAAEEFVKPVKTAPENAARKTK